MQLAASKPVYSSAIRVPAWCAALLLPLALLVLFPQTQPSEGAGAAGGAGGAAGAFGSVPHHPLAQEEDEEGGFGSR